MVADWNRALNRPGGRLEVNAALDMPALELAWHGHMPPHGEGTHGGSVIDGDFTDLDVLGAYLLADQPDSDHRAYLTHLRFPPRR